MKINNFLLIQSKRFESKIENQEKSESLFSKIRYVLNFYFNGSKLLYHQFKIYRQLKIKFEKKNFFFKIEFEFPLKKSFNVNINRKTISL